MIESATSNALNRNAYPLRLTNHQFGSMWTTFHILGVSIGRFYQWHRGASFVAGGDFWWSRMVFMTTCQIDQKRSINRFFDIFASHISWTNFGNAQIIFNSISLMCIILVGIKRLISGFFFKIIFSYIVVEGLNIIWDLRAMNSSCVDAIALELLKYVA